MRDSDIAYAVHGPIATLTFANPEKRNAFEVEHYARMRELIARARADSAVRVLVITGEGRAFSAGADLAFLSQDDPRGRSIGARIGEAMATTINPVITDLETLPVPVLCAMNGVAAGAAAGIALAADIVIAARSAAFLLPFAPKLGILPDLGTTWFLPRLVGRARATGLALLGDKLTAEQAAQWGLIWACVEDVELPATTQRLAQQLATLPPTIALELRRAYRAGESASLAEQLDYERERQSELLDRPAFIEGAKAFLGKR